MDIKDIIKLIKTINDTDIENVEIEKNDIKLKIDKGIYSKSERKKLITENVKIEELKEEGEEVDDFTGEDDLFIVKSPIVGVFYEAPNPDADPYIKSGDIVEEGDILCIVEAMKIMNEIESEVSGEIVEILVENEDVVEYGQSLMKIRR